MEKCFKKRNKVGGKNLLHCNYKFIKGRNKIELKLRFIFSTHVSIFLQVYYIHRFKINPLS